MSCHLSHTLRVRSGGAVVDLYLLECFSQGLLVCDFFHRHCYRRRDSSVPDSGLRHRASFSSRSACSRSSVVPFRAVGCSQVHFQLSRLFTGRGRLPSLTRVSWDRLSATFRYYAAIRLLSSLRHLVSLP